MEILKKALIGELVVLFMLNTIFYFLVVQGEGGVWHFIPVSLNTSVSAEVRFVVRLASFPSEFKEDFEGFVVFGENFFGGPLESNWLIGGIPTHYWAL